MGDLRGRASRTPWPDLLVTKIATNFPEFDHRVALDDTYRPLQVASAPAPRAPLEVAS